MGELAASKSNHQSCAISKRRFCLSTTRACCADLLDSTSQQASAPAVPGTRSKYCSSWLLTACVLGTTAFTASQLGENCGDRPLRWRVGHQPVLVVVVCNNESGQAHA